MEQAVIIAGGKGTRLSSRLGNLPKPLVDFCGKPLLYHQLELLKSYGFKDILILAGHKSEKIFDFINTNQNFGLNIKIISEAEPLGTSGSLLAAYKHLAKVFLVVYGDTMLNIDLERFLKSHKKSSNDITLFVHPNDHPHDSDIVEINKNNNVIAFHPYPHKSKKYYRNLVNAALYIVERDVISTEDVNKNIIFSDFIKDLFPKLLQLGANIGAYNSPEYIKDCGTPERLDQSILDFQNGKIKNSNLRIPQTAIFIDRDGTLNEEVGHLSDEKQFKLIDDADRAIKLINNSKYKCIVITNQPVIARGECSFEELQNIHNKMEALLGLSSSFIDRIYFCPHHPDSGFDNEVTSLKVTCNCRKPNIKLLELAKEEFNIDFNKSWFIGDRTVDIKTAKNCGIKSILVETGAAGKDGKYEIKPDFTKPNILSAVKHILKEIN